MKLPTSVAGCEKPGAERSLWLRSDQLGREWIDRGRSTFCAVPDSERVAQIGKLDSLHALKPGWDSYDAEPPTELAIENARRILHFIWSVGTMRPVRISPSVEGGVGIIFSGLDRKYADLECFNDGEILAVTSEGSGEPSVWSVGGEAGSLGRTIEKIRSFLNG